MKTKFYSIKALLLAAALLLTASIADARVYGVAAGPQRAVVSGPRGVAAVGPNGAAAVRRPVATTLPAGYRRSVPAGYRTVAYRGYNCRFVGGVYYRPVIYGGSTVYVVVS